MSLTWESHKETIRDLYLVKDLSRPEVMKLMEERHNITADAGQYERQFKKWAFRKNLSPDTWQFVARRIGKRKRDGKETHFRIDGIQVPQKKLQKAISRYGEGPTWKKIMHKLSQEMDCRSPTPAGLSFSPAAICASPAQAFNYLVTLPCFKLSAASTPLISSLPQLPEPLAAVVINYSWTDPQTLSRTFFPNQHDTVSQPQHDFSDGPPASSLMSIAFLASNHILDSAILPRYVRKQSTSAIANIVQQFQVPEFSKSPKRLNIKQYPTLDALSEVISKEALESGNLDVVRFWLKNSKLQLDELLPGPWKDSASTRGRAPLHIAIISQSVEMVQLLLGYGADPHKAHEDGHDMLDIAALYGTEEMIFLLLQAYKKDPAPALENALHRMPPIGDETFWMRMLSSSLGTGRFKPDLLITAAGSGWYAMAQYLLHHGADVNSRNDFGETPLLAALLSSADHLEMAKLFAKSGTKLESNISSSRCRTPTALQAAVYSGSWEAATFIMDIGADINAEGCDEGWRSSPYLNVNDQALWGQNALCLAIKFAAPCHLQELLRKGARADDTALASAVEGGSPDKIQLLLGYCAQSQYSNKVLFAAARSWNLDMIRRCLNAQLDVNHVQGGTNALGAAPLHLQMKGVIADFMETCNLLLHFGANINHPSASVTALNLAVSARNAEAAKFLFSRGAHCDSASAIRAAVRSGDSFMLEMVLTAAFIRPSCRLNYTTSCLGHQALFEAVVHWNPRMVDVLMQAGINLATPCASMALQLLCNHPSPNISLIQKLIDAGINVNLPDISENPSCWDDRFKQVRLHPLQCLVQRGHYKEMRLLLDSGADPNLFGQTAVTVDDLCYTITESILCSAVQSGKLSTVRLLLDFDADINSPARGNYGRTALQEAAELGRMDIFEELVQAGADIHADPGEFRGVTALQAAAMGGFLSIAAKLVEMGANVNAAAVEEEGMTALEAASAYGRIDMVQLLLDAGADVQSPHFGDIQYKNAVYWASSNGYNAVARLLQSHRERLS